MKLYNDSSGQVYTEIISAKAQSMIPAWPRQTTGGSRSHPSTYRHLQIGSPSLQSMAMRSCLWYVDHMDPVTLKWLGWHHASKIYQQLKQTNTLSFAAWTLFQRVYPAHMDHHPRFRFPRPEELSHVVDRLARLDGSVLTFLTLQDYDFKVDHLLALIHIPALAALMVDPGDKGSCSTISSKNLRDWGRAVHETGAFTHLALVILNGMMPSDTTAILDATHGFPALRLLGVQGGKRREKRPLPSLESPWIDADATLSVSTAEHPDCTAQGPRHIWADQSTTQIDRIHLLYNLAASYKTTPPTPTTTPEAATVTHPRLSLSFGRPPQNNNTTLQSKPLHWFFKSCAPREPTHTHTSIDTHTHAPSSSSPPHQAQVAPKRKKIRATMKKDIGALLGTLL